MKAFIFSLALSIFVSAEPAAVSWTGSSDDVDGYRIYKGDLNSRVFVSATSETDAIIDAADGESFFVTAWRGTLESDPSDILSLEFQDSDNLSSWKRVSQAAPGGLRYLTRFKARTAPQPAPLVPGNSTSIPSPPSDLGLDPVLAINPTAHRKSWLRQFSEGPPLIRTAADGPPVYPETDIAFVGQRCRVGDGDPYEWYWAASPNRWEREDYPPGIRDLPTPWIIAHRGGWNVAPEHTLEAYRMSVASGIRFIEPDVQVLQDGTVVVMHDSTINRTTTGTGNVSDQTGITWRSLLNDDGARLPGWSTRLRCPTFDEVLREFGNRVVIVPEAKNTGAGTAIVAKLHEFNIRKDMAIIQGSITELAPGVAAGYPCMRMSSTDHTGTIAAGIEFTGFGWNETDKIAAATAAGLKVIVWTTQRNVDLDSALVAGAVGAFSDDPVYQAGLHRLQHDAYHTKATYHGSLRGSPVAISLDTAESAVVIPTKLLARQDTVLLGWASPVADPQNFILEFEMKFTGVASDSSYGVIATQTTDRAIINDALESAKFSMNMILRRDGRIELHVYDGLTAGSVAVSSASPVAADLIGLDTWVPFRLTVTPAQIAMTRIDSGATAMISNNQIRGDYLFAGSKGADVKFKSMSLAD